MKTCLQACKISSNVLGRANLLFIWHHHHNLRFKDTLWLHYPLSPSNFFSLVKYHWKSVQHYIWHAMAHLMFLLHSSLKCQFTSCWGLVPTISGVCRRSRILVMTWPSHAWLRWSNGNRWVPGSKSLAIPNYHWQAIIWLLFFKAKCSLHKHLNLGLPDLNQQRENFSQKIQKQIFTFLLQTSPLTSRKPQFISCFQND